MLSTLRDFSIKYPVKNCNACSDPAKKYRPALKTIAKPIQTTLHVIASRMETVCALRWNTPRSIANIASTNTVNPTHNQILPANTIVLSSLSSYDFSVLHYLQELYTTDMRWCCDTSETKLR